MIKGILAIQCTANNGEIGTFLFEEIEDGVRIPLTPIFSDSVKLYEFLDNNKWIKDQFSSKHPTGIYSKADKP